MDMEVKTWKIGTDDVGGSAAVAVAAGGFASGEVDAVGERVCSGEGAEVVVVAGVSQGVAQDEEGRRHSLRHGCRPCCQ
jgi:hypothetical protein